MILSHFFYTHAPFVCCCINDFVLRFTDQRPFLGFTFITASTIYHGKEIALMMSSFIIVSVMGWFTS